MQAAKQTPPDAKARILAAAEALFAEYGFDGAGMKQIAARAGVAQGLLHYHYDDKPGLYAAVVAHRSQMINAARTAALDTVDLSSGRGLEAVLFALLRPTLGDEGGGTAYARIFGSLAVGTERDTALVEKHYDATARVFISAIERTVPGITRRDAAWGYSFAIGSLVTILGRTGRPERLADEPNRLEDLDAVTTRLVTFLAAGMRQLGPKTNKTNREDN
ncbi:MAG: TetR/AcrR family transcriptional regulator [Pseudomonadota bacterium]